VPIPRHLAREHGLGQSSNLEVVALEEDGPAAQAGLEEEDVIVALGDAPATSIDDLHRELLRLPVGMPATITLLRGQRRLVRMVIPADYPAPGGE
jgi:S1-C subfamily serine protease